MIQIKPLCRKAASPPRGDLFPSPWEEVRRRHFCDSGSRIFKERVYNKDTLITQLTFGKIPPLLPGYFTH